MDRIIRPFQTGDVFKSPVISVQQPPVLPTTEVSALLWGKTGDTTIVEHANPLWYQNWKLKEDTSKRQTVKVRVTNPQDNSQYVDIERLKSATFTGNLPNSTSKQSPVSLTLDFDASHLNSNETPLSA